MKLYIQITEKNKKFKSIYKSRRDIYMKEDLEGNIEELKNYLNKLDESGLYDAEKYSRSLLHQTSQLSYFYCSLVKDGSPSDTYYHVHKRPKEHQMAYFNIGRGFPKELMDGHWCYIVKDLGYKMLIIPCTSIKKESSPLNPHFEKDLTVIDDHGMITHSRMQLTDLRTVDIQRLDCRKPFYTVCDDREEIRNFIIEHLF